MNLKSIAAADVPKVSPRFGKTFKGWYTANARRSLRAGRPREVLPNRRRRLVRRLADSVVAAY
ncbi:MAG: hypothetical protein II649_09450 [Kiritimatiellae bacterium]|nr:hypothetical protein [Kiritimatiellia bacterium]